MNSLIAITLLLIATLFYFLPALIASNRRHHNAMAIAALNLLLGWTVIGWISSLVWSLTAVQDRVKADRVYIQRPWYITYSRTLIQMLGGTVIVAFVVYVALL